MYVIKEEEKKEVKNIEEIKGEYKTVTKNRERGPDVKKRNRKEKIDFDIIYWHKIDINLNKSKNII